MKYLQTAVSSLGGRLALSAALAAALLGACTNRNPAYRIDDGAAADGQRLSDGRATTADHSGSSETGRDRSMPSEDGSGVKDAGAKADLRADFGGRRDQGRQRDRGVPDLGRPDLPRLPDQRVRADLLQRPDLPPIIRPISTAALLSAFAALRVPCVMANGTVRPNHEISILDQALVHFWDDSDFARWDSETQAWIGKRSAVVVVFDPNACDLEDPVGNDADWQSAGIIIRNARLINGMLQLGATVTLLDMNVVEASFVKSYDIVERFATDDSLIPPQLREPMRAAKNAIFSLAH